MALTRKRRFRLPVLSRLTQAWLFVATVVAAFGAYSLTKGPDAPSRVAMPVGELERLAQPSPERMTPERPVTRATPDASSEDNPPDDETGAVRIVEADGDYAEDAFGGDYAPLVDEAADVIITIDGAAAQAPKDPSVRDADRVRRAEGTLKLAATDEALQKKSAYGLIPTIAADGRKPSQIYARPYDRADAAAVALIVGGLGLNRTLTERAIYELPPQVTLAFAPYAKDLPYWTQKARDAGHEIILELPMEQRQGDEAGLGPAALMTARTAPENAQRLEWMMSRFDGYVGATNYLGARFSADRTAMRAALQKIREAGLYYFDDTGAMNMIGEAGARDIAIVNKVVSPGFNGGPTAITRDLETLERIARRDGVALGKTYLTTESLDGVIAWAADARGREIDLAPASAAIALRKKES